MLECSFREDHLELDIKWRETPIKIRVYVFLCNKLCKDLNSEVLTREIKSTDAQVIIPVTSTSSIHQIIQGVIHYTIYSSRQYRIKNRGLLLGALILGYTQINSLTNILEKTFKASPQYYLIGVDQKPRNLEKCHALKLEDLIKKPIAMSILVKNAYVAVTLI